jgi:hypothetical protein
VGKKGEFSGLLIPKEQDEKESVKDSSISKG